MKKVFAATNQKGGVGKTTTCSAICGGLAARGERVLAVDLDPQGNLSFSLGVNTDEGPTVHDLFKRTADIHDVVRHTHVCDILPSNILLSGAELELTTIGREYLLREQLENIANEYDYAVIDTPPALSILTINAYAAATDLIIPMTPEILSLQGIAQLKDTIFAVRKYYNRALALRGILLTRYNPRLLLHKEVEELADIVAAQLDTRVFRTKIGTSVSVAEAPAHSETILEYAPRARATKDYLRFLQELLQEGSR